MRPILIDTHVLLRWLGDDERLGPSSRRRIADVDTHVLVSAATVREIAITRALGKLDAPSGFDGVIEEEGFEALAIETDHAERAGDLPALHRDPFDRMLVARAGAEQLVLMTGDETIRAYDIDTLDAAS